MGNLFFSITAAMKLYMVAALALFVIYCAHGFLVDDAGSMFICEHDRMTLTCDTGLIRVLYAYYGRHHSVICANHPVYEITNTSCHASNAKDIIAMRCDEKASCSMVIENALFNDPCYGTFKYAEVRYTCV